MKNKQFDEFKMQAMPKIASLLRELQNYIDDDCRASEEDETPSMQITISTDDELSRWNYQTGDNSFIGNCYGDHYWGIATLTKESDCHDLADRLLESLAECIEFED